HPKLCEARELTGRSISPRVLAHGPELLRTRVARVLAPGGRGGCALVTVGLRQTADELCNFRRQPGQLISFNEFQMALAPRSLSMRFLRRRASLGPGGS